MRRVKDWLDGHMAIMAPSEAPEIYCRWAGIAAIAAALQRKCYHMWDRRIYPNMYIALIGGPGTRKGTAIDPIRDYITHLGVPMSHDSGSRQAFITALDESRQGNGPDDEHASLTLIAGELVKFLGFGDMEFIVELCDLWDCPNPHHYRVVGRETNKIPATWVNIFGGATPEGFRESILKFAGVSGLASRFLFIFCDKRSKLVPLPGLQDECTVSDLKHDLENINALSGAFRDTEEFRNAYEEWYLRTERLEEDESDPLQYYRTRRSTHLRKLCMILSASRGGDMIINKGDFYRGLDILEEAELYMPFALKPESRLDTARFIGAVERLVIELKTVQWTNLHVAFGKDLSGEELAKILALLKRKGTVDYYYSKKLGNEKTLETMVVYHVGERNVRNIKFDPPISERNLINNPLGLYDQIDLGDLGPKTPNETSNGEH